jgi:hypothetical protein
MTKRDFKFLANAIGRANYLGITNKITFACDIAERLKAENPRFNKFIFIEEVKRCCSMIDLNRWAKRKLPKEEYDK